MKEYKNGIYSDDFTILQHIVKNVNLPFVFHENTKLIDDSAFKNSNITSIVLPEGLEVVECLAFENCKYLENITFPSTLIKIGECAFDGCVSLKQIDLSKTKLTQITEGAFVDCKNLEKVILPESVKMLQLGAFARCNIKEINLDNVNTIWDNVFENCKNLKLVLPKSVKHFTISSLRGTETKNLFIPETVESLFCTPLSPGSIEKITYYKLNANINKNFLKEQKNFDDVIIEKISLEQLLDNGKTFKEANSLIKELEK